MPPLAEGLAARGQKVEQPLRWTILHVVGARPNFVKVFALLDAMRIHPVFRSVLVHTGQHYDWGLSGALFAEMAIPQPDVHLGIGSGSHAEQTARIMLAFEPVVERCRPDLVLVVGDVNSTLAAALVAAKRGVRIAHVEAGLRSFDRSMPEEINRVLTDQLADFLFTHSPEAAAHLLREGIPQERIRFVGNVMIDALIRHLPQAQARRAWRRWGLAPKGYALLTLHRPSNVDETDVLRQLLDAVVALEEIPVLFPVHPRTRIRLAATGLEAIVSRHPRLHLIEPLGYLDFLSLLGDCALVLTDSGGIQEESTYLGVPCLTLRERTERPVTVTQGTNVLVGVNRERILGAARAVLAGQVKPGHVPELWDGQAAHRIVRILERELIGQPAYAEAAP